MKPDPEVADEPTRELAVYLNDHRAGAEAGLSLVRRLSRQYTNTALGDLTAQLAVEIEEDRDELQRLAEAAGVRENPIKELGAALGERISRLKLNSWLLRSSRLCAVLEIEALMAGIDAKRALWESLNESHAIDSNEPGNFDRLIDRATSQRDRLRVQHDAAARSAFCPSQQAAGR